MTAKKDLKKRVRSRQKQTGERYTAALEQVRWGSARKPTRVPVVELPDLSAIARAAGFKCRAYCSPSLWELRNDDEERTSLAELFSNNLRRFFA